MKIHDMLFSMAFDAMKCAYAPYSKFYVGVALLDDLGNVHSGCNVENAAYPEGLCAEAGAISAMIRHGGSKINQIIVMNSNDLLISPCGGCRQKIREFSDNNTRIYLCDTSSVRQTFTIDELLPYSFGSEHL